MIKVKNMERSRIIGAIVIVLALALGIFAYFQTSREVGQPPKQEQEEDAAENETPASEQDIRVFSPVPNSIVQSPLKISGEAKGGWYFEADFPIRLVDESGKEIGLAVAQAQGEWMTPDFVPFEATLNFSPSATETGKLIFEKDNPSGLPENAQSFSVPVRFASIETTTVKVFFSPSGSMDCGLVIPVERTIPRTKTVGRAALEKLLEGPSREEQNNKLFTSINEGVEIQKLEIRDGTAYVDFNEKLQAQVGGSCRVTAIRAQITETLKQFPTVQEVVISVNGETEGILQP
ncbi:MAG TPA: hypothetical protein DIT25_01325 [Candidatus Moranbacteria bacterium]|nr:hypothetical protein [Candidatus Moranbacteria bacterium]